MKDLFDFLALFGIKRAAPSENEMTGPMILANAEGEIQLFIISPELHKDFFDNGYMRRASNILRRGWHYR